MKAKKAHCEEDEKENQCEDNVGSCQWRRSLRNYYKKGSGIMVCRA